MKVVQSKTGTSENDYNLSVKPVLMTLSSAKCSEVSKNVSSSIRHVFYKFALTEMNASFLSFGYISSVRSECVVSTAFNKLLRETKQLTTPNVFLNFFILISWVAQLA